MTAPHSNAVPSIPEFGPLIPALVVEAQPVPAFEPVLAPARFALATALIDAAASARRALSEGDVPTALDALSRQNIEAAWTAARQAAAVAVIAAARQQLTHAGASARMPTRQAAAQLPTAEQEADLARRLGAVAVPLYQQLDRLAAASSAVRAEGPAAVSRWISEVERTARRTDESWRQLEGGAREAQREWSAAAARVHAWRPSPWPLYLGAALVLLVCLTIGLMIGGWIPVPDPLRPVAERIWRVV